MRLRGSEYFYSDKFVKKEVVEKYLAIMWIWKDAKKYFSAHCARLYRSSSVICRRKSNQPLSCIYIKPNSFSNFSNIYYYN
jgi:hypothetical protein